MGVPPVTHSAQDRHGFIPILIGIARATGVSGYIGRHLGLPAASIPAGQAGDHFKGFPFVTMDITMPSTETRQLLGWQPAHPGLIADLGQGHYFST